MFGIGIRDNHSQIVIILFTLFILVGPAFPADRPDTSALAGLWGSERVFGSSSPIRVAIRFDQDNAMVDALGVTAIVTTKGGLVNFTLPHDLGSFRGKRNGKNGNIAGHWISEPTDILYSQYATPLILRQVSSETWVGEVTPIELQFSLYFSIQPDASGEMRALLRNPERNQGMYTRVTHVEMDGSDVKFLDANGEQLISGTFDEASESLTIWFPGRGGSYDLTRRQRANAPGYYPRRDTQAYRYKQPTNVADGWTIAKPETVDMRSEDLEKLVQTVLDTKTDSLRTPYIQSLLVARRGKLVLEEYFFGYHSDRTHDLRSASKSVTGILVGQAINETRGLDVTTPVYSIFAGANPSNDPLRQRLTVQDLLTMSSGFACDDNNDDSPGREGRMQEQVQQLDWWQYALDLPMLNEPGSTAAYCSAGINLLGGVVSESTGVWLPEFFRSRLAEPLQISNYHMNLDPLGRGYAGGGIHMRPRDFLKIAQMMADKGTWNGRRVLSESWVSEVLQARASVNEPDDYGYTWWTGELPYRDSKVTSYSAGGNGGQLLIIVPELDLVLGINGGNYGDFRTWIAWRDKLVPDYVFRAIMD